MIASYAEAVAALYGRINYERLGSDQYTANDLKLERMRQLLAALGNPQNTLPVVHVAGTKGKGTVSTYVASMLQQAGYRVGLYTSPHMHRLEERFVVNAVPPTTEQLVGLVDRLMEVVTEIDQRDASLSPTFFECVNALAWMYFQQQDVQLAVLEVGLGGRLDSTNLCQPVVTAITSISLDHTRILGNTLRQIAGEKAGILKPDVPLVCGVLDTEPRTRIHEQAERVGAPLIQFQRDFDVETLSPWTFELREQTIRVTTSQAVYEAVLRQPGPVFACNAAIALACIDTLNKQGYGITPWAARAGLASAELPLRFEILREAPLLLADSAHNPASLRALIDTVRTVFPGRPVTLLLAVSRDKDVAAICRELRGCDRVIVSKFLGNERCLAPEKLRQILQDVDTGPVLLAETPAEALQLALSTAVPGEVQVASGSLFFAAEVRQLTQPLSSLMVQPA